jgi:alpha-amylase
MAPLRFVLGLHFHQPVGNFDHVFRQHVDDVYRPLLDTLEQEGLLPAVLHLSGPLLDWLERHEPGYLDRVAALARAGQLELLLSGYYEPILASLPRADRVEQVAWMREAIGRRFGVQASTLWLTERVWEPELAADLHDAGVAAVLVDDRHFLVSGFARDALHGWYRTESDGKGVGVFPIDERLRYLIPFQPPEDTGAYLRQLHASGHPLAILADDGEKFGGWPGTKEWVYEKRWLARFAAVIRQLVGEGTIVLATLREALDTLPPSGLAYLPTASYREMEGWSLPTTPQRALAALEHTLGEHRLAGVDGALVRGSHWRNFLVKYAEANRLQKLMSALSQDCRSRGDPAPVRQAIARAQCNDAYWHGVFGGLYLPHLRGALWEQLAVAEAALQARGEEHDGAHQAFDVAVRDLDGDGAPEIWVRGQAVSLVIAPARGGAIEVLLDLSGRRNLADTLTRRREAYHDEAVERRTATATGPAAAPGADSTASIHDIEQALTLDEHPPVDPHVRAISVDRLLPLGATTAALVDGSQPAIRSWAAERLEVAGRESPEWRTAGAFATRMRAPDGSLLKDIEVQPNGTIELSWTWTPMEGWFATELSLAAPVTLTPSGEAKVVRYPIETVSKSEKGFDRTTQGECVTVLWDGLRGSAGLRLELREGRNEKG